MRTFFWIVMLSLSPVCRADDQVGTAELAPATVDDLSSFDKALAERAPRPESVEAVKDGPKAKREAARKEIAESAKELRESLKAQKQQLKQEAREAAKAQRRQDKENRKAMREGADSSSNRASISGKRSGKEDNPGKGDHGKKVDGDK